MSVQEDLNHRRLGAAGVAAKLDQFSVSEVVGVLGSPDREIRRYGEAPAIRLQPRPAPLEQAWRVGDGRPPLATEDPAEVVAMNLCVLARTPAVVTHLGVTGRHPTACGWCDYPIEELHRAIAHALYFARFVLDHLLVWVGDDHGLYIRAGDEAGHYQNPAWEDMAMLHAGAQRELVQRVVEAVRA